MNCILIATTVRFRKELIIHAGKRIIRDHYAKVLPVIVIANKVLDCNQGINRAVSFFSLLISSAD